VTAIEVHSERREQMVDITDEVGRVVAANAVAHGVVHVFCTHTTAGVTINENADADVAHDLLAGLARMAPRDGGWRHREGNSDAHLKSTLVGAGVVVPVSDGRLRLGRWQGIYLCEFDGPRSRRVVVTVIGA
jgi:secondary thiamine-phosphate synthase enzyme